MGQGGPWSQEVAGSCCEPYSFMCCFVQRKRPRAAPQSAPGCSCCGMSSGVSLELGLLQGKVKFSPVRWATETSDLSATHCAICKSHRFPGPSGSLPPGAGPLSPAPSLGLPGSLLPHHLLFLSSLSPTSPQYLKNDLRDPSGLPEGPSETPADPYSDLLDQV